MLVALDGKYVGIFGFSGNLINKEKISACSESDHRISGSDNNTIIVELRFLLHKTKNDSDRVSRKP